MASYVVMTPPEGDPTGDRTLFIRDGFSLMALILPVFWFLWRRLWLWAIGFALIAVAANMLAGMDAWFYAGLALSVCSSVFAALEGQQLRIGKRESKGWRIAAVIEADDIGMAEEIFFAETPPVAADPAVAVTPFYRPPAPRRDDGFGIFEWNGGR